MVHVVILIILLMLTPGGQLSSQANVVGAPADSSQGVTSVEASPLEQAFNSCNGLHTFVPKHAIYDYMVLDATCDEKWQLAEIEMHESTFRETVKNPTSSALGSFQWLTSSWHDYGCKGSRTDRLDAAECSLKLIRMGYAHDTWYRWWK